MEQTIRTTAVRLAVLLFFIMAIAGWLWGCSPAVCAARAFAGAVVMYTVVQIAGRIVVKILIDAMVDSRMKKQADRDKE